MLRVRRPSPEELAALAERHAGAEPTYAPRGGTLTGDLLPGYVHDDVAVPLGTGDDTFDAARRALDRWEAHTGAGIVVARDAELEEGRTVALAAPLPVGWALATCRIIGVADEPDRYGFAYGTLPLHPEEGEEAFLVERDGGGEVRFRIVASSRPGHWATRLGGPVSRHLQRRALRAYLHALQRAVTAG